ncbi:MAG: HpcH/HpaI aldolase/citrate lyase family protein [Anaerovoracaceae bacterium]
MLKQRLQQGEKALGIFAKCPFIEIAEVIAYAGYDAYVIDRQHAIFTDIETETLMAVAKAAGTTPIVRIPSAAEEHIIHALDSGAEGIIIPGIETVEEAEKIARMTKFAPNGLRGMNGGARAAKHGYTPRADYMADANLNTMTMIMVENLYMVENIDKLGEIENIDGFFIGPADLSQVMGIPGQVNHPDLLKNVEKVAKSAKEHNKFVAVFAGSMEGARKFIDCGVTFIIHSTDLSVMNAGLKKNAADFKTL